MARPPRAPSRKGNTMNTNFNAISELRDLARAGAITLIEREVIYDRDSLAGDDAAYVDFRDVATIRGILRKLDQVPCVSRLTLTVETSDMCGKPWLMVTDGEGDNAETYACGNVDHVAGFMDAMRVAFTRISRAWYARGLM